MDLVYLFLIIAIVIFVSFSVIAIPFTIVNNRTSEVNKLSRMNKKTKKDLYDIMGKKKK